MYSKKRKIVFYAYLFGIPILCGLYQVSPLQVPEPDFHGKEYYIAHGGGIIDGYVYTNSREALYSSLEKGYKYTSPD